MDTTKIIELVIAAVAGGVFQKVLGPVLGLENSRIKSLTSIIDSLDKRVNDQDTKIKGLEDKIDGMNSDKYVYMERDARYKYAFEGHDMCPFHQQTGECIIVKRHQQSEGL